MNIQYLSISNAQTEIDPQADIILAQGTTPYCDHEQVEKVRSQCIQNHITFLFVSTGPKYKKAGIIYNIPENQQHLQAQRSNLSYFNHQDLFNRIEHSKFRNSFHLKVKDMQYIKDKGMDTIENHAKDFISNRLGIYPTPNDGKQTPMKGHPIFIGQHATATCCRGCLEKWHHIPKDRELTKEEQEKIVSLLMEWVIKEYYK